MENNCFHCTPIRARSLCLLHNTGICFVALFWGDEMNVLTLVSCLLSLKIKMCSNSNHQPWVFHYTSLNPSAALVFYYFSHRINILQIYYLAHALGSFNGKVSDSLTDSSSANGETEVSKLNYCCVLTAEPSATGKACESWVLTLPWYCLKAQVNRGKLLTCIEGCRLVLHLSNPLLWLCYLEHDNIDVFTRRASKWHWTQYMAWDFEW